MSTSRSSSSESRSSGGHQIDSKNSGVHSDPGSALSDPESDHVGVGTGNDSQSSKPLDESYASHGSNLGFPSDSEVDVEATRDSKTSANLLNESSEYNHSDISVGDLTHEVAVTPATRTAPPRAAAPKPRPLSKAVQKDKKRRRLTKEESLAWVNRLASGDVKVECKVNSPDPPQPVSSERKKRAVPRAYAEVKSKWNSPMEQFPGETHMSVVLEPIASALCLSPDEKVIIVDFFQAISFVYYMSKPENKGDRSIASVAEHLDKFFSLKHFKGIYEDLADDAKVVSYFDARRAFEIVNTCSVINALTNFETEPPLHRLLFVTPGYRSVNSTFSEGNSLAYSLDDINLDFPFPSRPSSISQHSNAHSERPVRTTAQFEFHVWVGKLKKHIQLIESHGLLKLLESAIGGETCSVTRSMQLQYCCQPGQVAKDIYPLCWEVSRLFYATRKLVKMLRQSESEEQYYLWNMKAKMLEKEKIAELQEKVKGAPTAEQLLQAAIKKREKASESFLKWLSEIEQRDVKRPVTQGAGAKPRKAVDPESELKHHCPWRYPEWSNAAKPAKRVLTQLEKEAKAKLDQARKRKTEEAYNRWLDSVKDRAKQRAEEEKKAQPVPRTRVFHPVPRPKPKKPSRKWEPTAGWNDDVIQVDLVLDEHRFDYYYA